MGVFYGIRTGKAKGLAALQIRVQVTNPKTNIRISSPIQVDIESFNLDRNSVKWKRFLQTPEGKELAEKMSAIEQGVNFILKKGDGITVEQLKKVVDDVCFEEQRRKEEEEIAAMKKAEEEKNRMTFKKYRKVYLEQIKTGGRSTYTGKNFARGTIVAISVAFNRLEDFEKKKRRVYDFEDIDMEFYRDFTAFMKKINYGLNTIGKTIKVIKTVMRCAEEDGYHNNHNYMAHSFKAPKADADAIYLTREEIQKITDIDLSDKCQGIQDARDIFLIGVWTAQRVSDYNNIQPEDIRRETIRSWDEDGNLSEKTVRTIHIVQQKTGKKVVIPCNKALRTILDKYPDGLPHLSEQKINKYLKEIGELCEFNDIVEVRNTKGGTLQTETFKKYELIHTHTARRTGATLMFLSGMNVYDICKITGHSNIKTLERYIKANELETVKKITDTYDYFK